jgi:hypothetical protein
MNNVKAKIGPMIVLLSCLILPACAGNQIQPGNDPYFSQDSLNRWLEADLIPYLVLQFRQHPRFKGQPILLVDMQGENIRARIDELTGQIRDKIKDALLKEPGLDLVWRPSYRPWQHHQRLEDVQCADHRKIHYYVGIDCGLTGEASNVYVKVRALNLDEHKWVAGFGRYWEGKLNKSQSVAMTREHPDEYLRGLRPLPFSDQQPDLLAAYLARNLSCLLQQSESDDLVVYAGGSSPANPPIFFKTTMDLVGKYLARFREVKVTDNPNCANVTLVQEIHTIHQELHQIWISAKHRQGEEYLPGAETEAYVRMDAPRPSQNAQAQYPKPPVEFLQPASQTPPRSGLISSFDLLTPLNRKFCKTYKPWESGIRRVAPYEHIASGSCLAVEMSLSVTAYVFLVSQDAAGDLTRLFPSACHSLEDNEWRIYPGQRFQLPSLAGHHNRILELSGAPGMEIVYAIAIAAPGLAERFAGRLNEIQDLCRGGKNFPNIPTTGAAQRPYERIRHWQNYLNHLSANHPGLMQWREIRFYHDAT